MRRERITKHAANERAPLKADISFLSQITVYVDNNTGFRR